MPASQHLAHVLFRRVSTPRARDPRVVKDRAAEEANATDATRVVCAICDARFAARNALFKHLRESGHGEQAEAAERAAKAAAAIGS